MLILAAVDVHQPESVAVVDAATRFAAKVGARLDLAYVDPVRSGEEWVKDPGARRRLHDAWTSVHERDRRSIDELLARIPPSLRGRARTPTGDPATELVSLAPEYDAVLVATHARKGLARALLGSVADQVIRGTRVPVVVVRVGGDTGTGTGTG